MIQFRQVRRVLALLLVIFAQFLLLPAGVALIYRDGALTAFLASYALTLGLGLAAWWPVRRAHGELRKRDGFLIVGAAWSLLALVSTLPLLLSGMTHSLTDALFETTSGLTTTGSTVFTGLDALPHALNFWRLLLNWLGGMGILVLAVAVLPLLGVGGRQIFKAETPGPLKEAALTPRIAGTAKILWLIYAGLTALCALALWGAGMTPFDAVTHSFAALSAGGLSTHDASIGYFHSPLIEFILILAMLAAGINFATHFLALRGGGLRAYWRDSEARALLAVIAAGCLLAALYLWARGVYPDFLSALRYASFNLVSLATCTGFVNADYNRWPVFVPVLMLVLSCFTASAGSTGGGIKMVRALLLLKQGLHELRRLIHPDAVGPVKFQGRRVGADIVAAVWGFFFLYVAAITVATLALLLTGMDVVSALSAVIASINNAGPGLDAVGPAANYGGLPLAAKWILIFTMLAGRLELYTLLVLFTPAFWRY